jgi:hypothetical protein
VCARANECVLCDVSTRGYPTLKLLRDSNAYAYSGARQLDAFKAFAASGYEKADKVARGNTNTKTEL